MEMERDRERKRESTSLSLSLSLSFCARVCVCARPCVRTPRAARRSTCTARVRPERKTAPRNAPAGLAAHACDLLLGKCAEALFRRQRVVSGIQLCPFAPRRAAPLCHCHNTHPTFVKFVTTNTWGALCPRCDPGCVWRAPCRPCRPLARPLHAALLPAAARCSCWLREVAAAPRVGHSSTSRLTPPSRATGAYATAGDTGLLLVGRRRVRYFRAYSHRA